MNQGRYKLIILFLIFTLVGIILMYHKQSRAIESYVFADFQQQIYRQSELFHQAAVILEETMPGDRVANRDTANQMQKITSEIVNGLHAMDRQLNMLTPRQKPFSQTYATFFTLLLNQLEETASQGEGVHHIQTVLRNGALLLMQDVFIEKNIKEAQFALASVYERMVDELGFRDKMPRLN